MNHFLSSQLFPLALVLAPLLASCGESKSNGRDVSAATGDTAAPVESPAHSDSTTFIPDGYYLPHGGLSIAGRKIGSLELITVQRVDSAGQFKDPPTLLRLPVGTLIISQSNGSDSSYPCTVTVIVADSLSVRCASTSIGDLTIDGHFLEKGDYSDKLAETSTEALVARVVTTKSGRIVHNAFHRFTYYTGD